VTDGIAILDPVKREDRKAFAHAASIVASLSPEQRSAGIKKADAYLEHAGIDALRSKTILDLGCGLGDLTFGLSSTERVEHCVIYAVDHSIESLRVLLASISPQHGNRVHVSTQDASVLCFPDGSLDFIAGSAILHHVLDYRALLRSILPLLRPGGKAIFAEPFLGGYLITSLFLAIAAEQLKLNKADLKKPEFGMCQFLIDDTAYRVSHEHDLPALNHLADKHLFRENQMAELGSSLGFTSVSCVNQEAPEFYDDFMRHIMSVYGITDPALTAAAARYYGILRRLCGQTLPDVVSHFKYIVFTK
jgi:SAM-dependent methyltransferase